MDLSSPIMTPIWLGLATTLFLVILSWLYQIRDLPKIWMAISLPLFFGIGTAITWKEHVILGFIYGALIGLVTVPIALSAKPQRGKRKPPSEQRSSDEKDADTP